MVELALGAYLLYHADDHIEEDNANPGRGVAQPANSNLHGADAEQEHVDRVDAVCRKNVAVGPAGFQPDMVAFAARPAGCDFAERQSDKLRHRLTVIDDSIQR